MIGVPSGLQPRAAVIYMTVAALQCAAACGAAPSLQGELEGAVAAAGGAGRRRRARPRWPQALEGTIPVVHGAELTAAPARRWKGQLNENANVAAFASELPEANHNEIEGWAHAHEHGPFSAVFLGSPGLHPRVQRRIELYSEVLEADGVPVVHVQLARRHAGGRGAVAGHAGRPGQRRAGRAERGGPGRDGRHRGLQGAALSDAPAQIAAEPPQTLTQSW